MPYEREQLRFQTYDAIYISPHMDDAAFSCAGRILLDRAQGKRSLVVTVFGTGSEGDGRSGAFADYGKRKLEELAAMAALDADFVWLNQPELLYRKPALGELLRYIFPFFRLEPGELQQSLYRELGELCRRYLAPTGTVYFPFAVGFHPDHRILFDVGRALHAAGACPVRFYDDVPYALTPALCAHRLRYLGRPEPVALFRHTTEINRMLFWRIGAWSRLSWFVVLVYLAVSYLLRGLTGSRDAFPSEPQPAPDELAIGPAIEEKLRIMALYPSQIVEFFPDGLLPGLFRNEAGQLVERSWCFPAFPPNGRRLSGFEQGAQVQASAP
jgi:LmbE family N-acetylglucosaminyl deacetylase